MDKQFVSLSIFFSIIMFLLFGFVIFSMRDGLPVDFSVKNKNILNSKTVFSNKDSGVIKKTSKIVSSKKSSSGFLKFSSEKELKDYLAKSKSKKDVFFGGLFLNDEAAVRTSISAMGKTAEAGVSVSAQRFSGTNVQVAGIDEPDIVKTDGENIYFSSQNYYRGVIEPIPVFKEAGVEAERKIMPYYENKAKTRIIKAFPPKELKEKSFLDKNGKLLLSNNSLIIFSGNFIYAYDVKDSKNPQEKWKIELKNNNQFVQARLYDDKIYLITKKGLDRYNPCPIIPFAVGKEDIVISCENIYHPKELVPVDLMYSVSTIDVDSGKMNLGISFLGSYSLTLYMSKDALFAAYTYFGDTIDFFYNFILENKDIFSNAVLERIKTLKSYDLSQNTKMMEFQIALEKFKNSLNEDDSLKFENEMENRMSSYVKKYKRELQKTDIVKITLDKLSVSSVGTVPGRLLNQFAMDEYKNNLRVATTIGQRFSPFGFGGTRQSENDVYILDNDMNIIGSALGFGLDERIYSVRFMEDKAYIVTFKQIDPFFIMDLSNSKDPKITGELKIPGYSSYLHPINKDMLVGIGKEASKVKISLFDVSDSKNPKEISKYILDEYWSELLSTQYAFLLDKKHKIFFMPGSKGAYVFSYENKSLKLKKAVSGIRAKRAVYLDDYLYIVGTNKIVVLNQLNWERLNELSF